MRSAPDEGQKLGRLPGNKVREGLDQHAVDAGQDAVEHGEAVSRAGPVVEEDDDRDDLERRQRLEGHDDLGLGVGVGLGEHRGGVQEGIRLVGCVKFGSSLVFSDVSLRAAGDNMWGVSDDIRRSGLVVDASCTPRK